MIISLKKIGQEPFVWRESLSVSADSLRRQELLKLSEVACRGQVSVVSAGHLLQASLSYEQTLACSRCLGPVTEPVESQIELVISPRSPEPTAGEVELEESDLNTLFVDDEQLDTRPILLEQLQLNIPMRSHCREDCAGLCPVCGANRNEATCECADQEVDPRWEALRALSGDQ